MNIEFYNRKIIHHYMTLLQRQKMYKRMAQHFEMTTYSDESKVLKKYADNGFEYTTIFICIRYSNNFIINPYLQLIFATSNNKNFTAAASLVIVTFKCLPIIRSYYCHIVCNIWLWLWSQEILVHRRCFSI